MPVRVSPADAADRWVQGMSGAGAKITAGVNGVSVSPGVKAAQAKAKWVAAMADPRTQSKWETNVRRMDVDTWRRLMIEVGIPRIAAGAQAKKDKYVTFAESFFPFLTRVVAEVDAMPSTDFASRVNRAVQLMTLLHNYKPGA